MVLAGIYTQIDILNYRDTLKKAWLMFKQIRSIPIPFQKLLKYSEYNYGDNMSGYQRKIPFKISKTCPVYKPAPFISLVNSPFEISRSPGL